MKKYLSLSITVVLLLIVFTHFFISFAIASEPSTKKRKLSSGTRAFITQDAPQVVAQEEESRWYFK